MNEDKQMLIRMSEEEKRALRMLAGALNLSVAGFTREVLKRIWEEKFPDMEYPDKNGNLKPKKGKQE